MASLDGTWTHACTPHRSGLHAQDTQAWLVLWGGPPVPMCVEQFWECIWPLWKHIWFLLVQEVILMVRLTTDSIIILLIFTQSTCFKEIDMNSTCSTSYLSLKCYGRKYTVIQLMCLLFFSWTGTTAFKPMSFQSNTGHPYTFRITQRVTHAFIAHICPKYPGNWNSSIIFYQVVQTSLKSVHFSHYWNTPYWMDCQSRHKSCSGVPPSDNLAALETTVHATTKEHQKLQR